MTDWVVPNCRNVIAAVQCGQPYTLDSEALDSKDTLDYMILRLIQTEC